MPERSQFRSSYPFPSLAKAALHNLHWLVTAILALAVVPTFRMARLSLRINWAFLFVNFWIGLASQAIFAAALLYLLVSPVRRDLRYLAGHYRAQPVRLVILTLLAVVLIRELGWEYGLILVVALIALAEYFDRNKNDAAKLVLAAKNILIPACYFFVGVVLVFCYNDLIASVRFYGSCDPFFNKLDALLFHGLTAATVTHFAAQHLPLSVFKLMEIIYYGMFAQIGAAFLFTGLIFGKKRTLELAGTLLTAYYISLAIFFVWPSIGPYAFGAVHQGDVPRSLATYNFHMIYLDKARALWTRLPTSPVSSDFFIAFPSMHIAQPLIVLWFLRKWKRIAAALIIYDALLIPSIILLGWHYFVDLLGGVLVAAVAIVMLNMSGKVMGSDRSGHPTGNVYSGGTRATTGSNFTKIS